jgi:kynurenine formamidase
MRRNRALLAVVLLATAANLWVFAQNQKDAKPPADPAAQETPAGPRWWPSEWGPDDERGAANRLTPQKVLEAKSLITAGKVYQLGRDYEAGMPIPGKRHFSLTIPGLPTGNPMGKNGLVHNDELVSGEIGQVGTQFDGLGHVGVRVGNDDVFYNGNKLAEFGTAYGLTRLGVEKAGPFFTRGVLLDVAAVREERSLPPGYVVTPDDLQKALGGGTIRPGDAVFIHTGHGFWWMKDNKKFGDGEPGIGLAAARWLSDRKVSLVGSDNWAVEVVPAEDPDRPYPCHQWLLTRHGIYLLECLDLSGLAKDKVTEFAFVFSPLRLKGATGSPGNPIAVR